MSVPFVLSAGSTVVPTTFAAAQRVIEQASAGGAYIQRAAALLSTALETPLETAMADWGLAKPAIAAHLTHVTELFVKLASSAPISLADELMALPPFGSGRNREIFLSRLGFGEGIRTFEELGSKHGITRERVRQLFGQFEKRARAIRPPLPFLSSCGALVRESQVPLSLEEWWERIPHDLRKGSLNQLEGVIAISKYNWLEELCVTTISDFRFVQPKTASRAAVADRVADLRVLTKELRWVGLIKPELYADRTNLGLERVYAALGLIADQILIPEGNGWLAVPRLGDPLVERVSKMLTELGPLSVESVRDGLRRDRAFLRGCRSIGLPPLPALSFVLSQRGFSVDSETGIVEFAGRSHRYRATGAEREVIRWLRNNQPATREEVLAAVEATGYSRIMAAMVISRSPLVERKGMGIYSARGADLSARSIAEARRRQSLETGSAMHPVEILREPGKVLLEYDLSAYARGTTISIPTAAVPRGVWRLRSTNKPVEFRVRSTYVTGLAAYFSRALDRGYKGVRVRFWLADRELAVTAF